MDKLILPVQLLITVIVFVFLQPLYRLMEWKFKLLGKLIFKLERLINKLKKYV